MKKVFTRSSDVIHLFAQQSQSEARCTNVFFHNNRIYSYGTHYLLGEFIDANTIMINDNSPSVTTSKHVRELIYGTRQYRQFFTTETDLRLLKYQFEHNVKKLTSARKPELYLSIINNLWDKLQSYLEYAGRLETVKNNVDYQYLQSVKNHIDVDYADYVKNLIEIKKQQDLAKKERDAKELEVKLQKFYNFDIDNFRVGDEDFVRLSLDRDEVETSQGIRISRDQARILYLYIQQGKDIRGHKIGNYTVKSINGTLKIGCHNINMESVHRVGKFLIN